MSMTVIRPGVLSLIQDRGRFGHHRIGLTNGGPLDYEAYSYCNRLLENALDAAVIEISVGGLELRAEVDTFVCLTGAPTPFLVNGEEHPQWQVVPVKAGDTLSVQFTARGCRCYLGVADGFAIPPSFGSAATVVREGIGGLHGGKLRAGDTLSCTAVDRRRSLCLEPQYQPRYQDMLTVRVVPGYQQHLFSREQQRRFFGGPYRVSERCDRMGYRLEGQPISCDSGQLLSEGICHGAIQLPPDGQPIVLLNDRQTIGGYPKIGSALLLDTWRLGQLVPGNTVHFTPISLHTARKALELARRFTLARPLREC